MCFHFSDKTAAKFYLFKQFKGMVSQEQSMTHTGVLNSFVSLEHFIILNNIWYVQQCEET